MRTLSARLFAFLILALSALAPAAAHADGAIFRLRNLHSSAQGTLPFAQTSPVWLNKTLRGEGAVPLGYSGVGTLAVQSETCNGSPTSNWGATANKLVIAGSPGTAPPTITGTCTVVIGDQFGARTTVTIPPVECCGFNVATTTELTNALNGAAAPRTVNFGDEIRIRAGTYAAVSLSHTGTYTVRGGGPSAPVNRQSTGWVTVRPDPSATVAFTSNFETNWAARAGQTNLYLKVTGLQFYGINLYQQRADAKAVINLYSDQGAFSYLWIDNNLISAPIQQALYDATYTQWVNNGSLAAATNFTASLTSSVMTVTSGPAGLLSTGMGVNFPGSPTITAQLSGTSGGVGTYSMTAAADAASGTRVQLPNCTSTPPCRPELYEYTFAGITSEGAAPDHVWITDNHFLGAYDGIDVGGHNLKMVGNLIEGTTRDAMRGWKNASEVAFNVFINKYADPGAHGDFIQESYTGFSNTAFTGTKFVGNILAPGITVGFPGQGIFTGGGTGNSHAGQVQYGNFIILAHPNAIYTQDVINGATKWNTIVPMEGWPTGNSLNITMGGTQGTGGVINYNVSKTISICGTCTQTGNQLWTTGLAELPLFFVNPDRTNTSSVATLMARWGPLISGPLDGSPKVGAFGTGYIDYTLRTASYPDGFTYNGYID